MILRSVGLESFGRFRGVTFEFRRGMNLVIGPNEAGKSTLAEAVPAVLFGVNQGERFKPWGRQGCSATLYFEGGGRSIQVKRNLITDEVELVERDDLYHILSEFKGKAPLNGRSTSSREYRELLASLLGVGDEELFRATYFFGHQPKEWHGETLAQNLRVLVGGGAESDYAEILDELLEEHFNLTRENPWGRDKQRDREYEEVCREIETFSPVESVPMFVEFDDPTNVSEEIEKLTAELDHDRSEYEKGRRHLDKIRERQRHHHANDPSLSGQGKLSSQTVISNDIIKQLTSVGLPEKPPRNLLDLLSEGAEIRQSLSELQKPFADLAMREKQIPTVHWTILFAVIVLLSITSALAFWQDMYPVQVLVFSSTVIALGALGCGWRLLARQKAQRQCNDERQKLEQLKSELQLRQTELTHRCEAVGLPSSPVDLVRIEKLSKTHRALLEDYWSDPDREKTEVRSSTSQAEHATEERNSSPEEEEMSANLQELEERMRDFEKHMQHKSERLMDLKKQLESHPPESSPGKQGNLFSLQKRKETIEKRIRLLRRAITLLADAVDEFSRSHLASLNEEATKLFSKMTGGRYSKVKLDENMTPAVQLSEHRWVSPDSLSKGTVDALYLALRTALAKVRDDGRSLPLMLDDPFVHLDQKRLSAALNQVDLASMDGQMILFSHNLELGKRAAKERWHVVSLNGESDQIKSEEEGEKHDDQLHLL